MHQIHGKFCLIFYSTIGGLPSMCYARFLPNEPETFGGNASIFAWVILTIVLSFYLAYRNSDSGGNTFGALLWFFGTQLVSLVIFLGFARG
jgi:hypothetical protein